MNNKNEALKIADNARKSLSKYCSTECKAYCCRDGYLLLNLNQINHFKNLIKEDLKIMTKNIVSKRKKYVLNLNPNCPNLINNKCSIHKNEKRPKTCKDYPLFLVKNKAMVTKNCPAVYENKLYSYLHKLKKLGYKVIYVERD